MCGERDCLDEQKYCTDCKHVVLDSMMNLENVFADEEGNISFDLDYFCTKREEFCKNIEGMDFIEDCGFFEEDLESPEEE
jgi:hypothetical protein